MKVILLSKVRIFIFKDVMFARYNKQYDLCINVLDSVRNKSK